MDWTEFLAWASVALTVGYALRAGWRPWTQTPVTVPPKGAQLLGPGGRLDSVRTVTVFPPPKQFDCAAGRYVLDPSHVGTHYVYRRTDVESPEAAE